MTIFKPLNNPLDSPPLAAMVYTHVVAFDEVRKMYAHLLTEQHVLLSSVSSSSRLDEMVFRIDSSENFRSENVLGVQEKGPEDRRT